MFLGNPTYAVQFTTLMRGVTMLTMGLVLITRWRSFTRDEDVRMVEEIAHERAIARRSRPRRLRRAG